MIALIRPVTYVCPALTSAVRVLGDRRRSGSIQDTAGSVPAFAAVKKLVSDWMLPSWLSCWTSAKMRQWVPDPRASVAFCGTGAQVTALSFSQSGSVPLST